MFWKKKKPKTEIIPDDADELRNTFRYCFKEGQGFFIRFRGKAVRVVNISAEGLAFKNQGFNPLDADAVGFTLDVPNFKGDTSFSADLKILTIDEDQLCHCIFDQCPPEQSDLLHKYVLEM
ncbi:MAG: hypothetical protein WC836_07035, partial [Desulfobacula sp.]